MTLNNKIAQYATALGARGIFAAIAIVAAVGAVVAADGFSGAPRRSWRRGQSAAESIESVRQALRRGSPWLDLAEVSDLQRVELGRVAERHGAALRQLEADRQRLIEQFSSGIAADVLNPADIEIARTDARALGERAIDESVVLLTEAAQILTPQQRKKLVELWRGR